MKEVLLILEYTSNLVNNQFIDLGGAGATCHNVIGRRSTVDDFWKSDINTALQQSDSTSS